MIYKNISRLSYAFPGKRRRAFQVLKGRPYAALTGLERGSALFAPCLFASKRPFKTELHQINESGPSGNQAIVKLIARLKTFC